jgi:hypothetical protein
MTTPGWYPDPSQPGAVRWWDGQRWSDHSAPAQPVYQGTQTEGLAIASLITALIGIPIAPIILGHMARARIRESGGTKDGDGLAIAGLVIGYLLLALFVIIVLVAVAIGTGSSSSGY